MVYNSCKIGQGEKPQKLDREKKMYTIEKFIKCS